jgi:hypothetical protein
MKIEFHAEWLIRLIVFVSRRIGDRLVQCRIFKKGLFGRKKGPLYNGALCLSTPKHKGRSGTVQAYHQYGVTQKKSIKSTIRHEIQFSLILIIHF